jgi:hypothetical protein
MTRHDFSGSGTQLIDQGMYPCTVTGMEIKTSQNSGNDYYAFEFTIASGDFEGMKLWHNNSINAKDRNFYLRQTLEGIRGMEIPLEADVDINVRDYIGRGCMVQVIHEEYKGEVKPRVAGIHPPEDGVTIEAAPSSDPYADAPPATADGQPW